MDKMLYDVGFLWILEEACFENTGKRGMFEDECTKTRENNGILKNNANHGRLSNIATGQKFHVASA